ncbi:MAG: MCE family protein [Thermoleophilaceae bacterium]|nr:MCE family protein [Thermoleophilaceae bacterium]
MKHAIRTHIKAFLAVLGVIVIGVAVAVGILSEQGVRFPFVEAAPKRIEVELSDAQAVEPGRGQTVRVAGVEIGKIAGVRLEDGRAVVELDIEHRYGDMVRADATALLRPKTALKDMFLEVDPGTGRVVPEGGRIGVSATAPDVDPDEILAALDADTRPYLKLLIAGAGKGLRDRGDDLNATLRRLEPLHRDLARVTQATAKRRKALKRLVHSYGLLTSELGRHPSDLERLVSASGEVFGSLAGEDDDIATATARLPGALRRSEATLGEVGGFARELPPTLDALLPAVRRLPAANAALRPFFSATTPVLRDQIRPFVRAARPWTADLRTAAVEGSKAAPDLRRALGSANRFLNMGAFNPGGAEGLGGLNVTEQRARQEGLLYWLAWTAQNGVSLFNTADAQGPWRRVTICGVDAASLGVLLNFTLTNVGQTNPTLLQQLTGASDGTIVPGSPVQNLLDTQFGSCDFDDLPTSP